MKKMSQLPAGQPISLGKLERDGPARAAPRTRWGEGPRAPPASSFDNWEDSSRPDMPPPGCVPAHSGPEIMVGLSGL